MKREINCDRCAKKWPTYVDPNDGEYLKQISGKLKRDALCDGCSTPLNRGDMATATSLYTNTIPYFEWEETYLDQS